MTKVTIIYKGDLTKNLLFDIDEDFLFFLKRYNIDPDKDLHIMKRIDEPDKYYKVFVPKPNETKMGVDEDDRILEIKGIIIEEK